MEEVVENADEKELNDNVTEEGLVVSAAVVGETENKAAAVEDSEKTKEMPSEEEKDTVKVEVNGDVKAEVKDLVKTEEDSKEDENVVNGKPLSCLHSYCKESSRSDSLSASYVPLSVFAYICISKELCIV